MMYTKTGGFMAFANEYDFDVLTNGAESLVVDELGRQLESYQGEICRCEICVIDMAAMALNIVKPLYRVSLLGTQYAAQAINDRSYADSLKEAVSTAIERVQKNPAHD